MSISLDLRTSYKEPVTLQSEIGAEDFRSQENSLIKGGNLSATIQAHANSVGISLNFRVKGTAVVECDRCLDDMDIDIDLEERLQVEFADRFEDSDEVVYVDKSQSELDLWPFIYDFVSLAIPMVHCHKEGECNEQMIERLNQYMVGSIDDDKPSDETNEE